MSTADEVLVSADPPLWELAHWRERYGLVAGITGRGTDPAEPFDLGLWSQSPVAATMTRWQRFRQAFAAFDGMVLSRQVHQTRIGWYDRPKVDWTLSDGLDGHATNVAGLLLLVTVADCVPVYLAVPTRGVVALLHAGWRGTAGGILALGVGRICAESGSKPSDVVMHCGVAISGPCYEVGREVMNGVAVTTTGPGPWHVDLRSVLTDQAHRLGLTEVTTSNHCTACPDNRFFSHRGSRGADGRMVGYLGIPGPRSG